MTISTSEVERRVDQAIHTWESSCPEQSFGDMTLEQFRQALQPFHDSKARFAAANVNWDTARQQRNAAYTKAVELLKCVVNSVKGHPKFGENSAVYSAMGYVATNDRSSGLTRRREKEAPKGVDEAS